VRDRIAELMQEWIATLEKCIVEARDLKQLKPDTDHTALAFRLHGYELSLNLRRQLLGDKRALALARSVLHEDLRSHATSSGRRLLDVHWNADPETARSPRLAKRTEKSPRQRKTA
jgi:hypothetical protein